MIITKTPYRISLTGGNSDLKGFYEKHGGIVVGGTINKYGYITLRELPSFYDYKYHLVYSKIERAKSLDCIKHKAIRACLEYSELLQNFEIHYFSDLSSKSDLGASSAFVVGLLNALNAFKGDNSSCFCPISLAKDAIYVEQTILQESVGSQDSVWAAVGGLNYIEFHKDGQIKVYPLPIDAGDIVSLESHLMLFWTGIERNANKIASTYAGKIASNELVLKMFRLVEPMIEAITSHNYYKIGTILHENWMLKRNLSSSVSSDEIDNLYQLALSAGAWGGKILGSGGGGCLLLAAPPERHNYIRKALSTLHEIKFHFEFGGSKVILYNND